MGNCLVTKLKGTVNNSNLPIYNTIVLDIKPVSNPSSASQWINFLWAPNGFDYDSSSTIELEVIGDGYIIKGSDFEEHGQNIGKHAIVNINEKDNGIFYYASNGTYLIHIKTLYGCNSITIPDSYYESIVKQINDGIFDYNNIYNIFFRSNANIELDLSHIGKFKLRSFDEYANGEGIYNTRYKGDLSSILYPELVDYVNILGAAQKVTGSLNVFNNSMAMTYIRLYGNPNVTCDLDSLLAGKSQMSVVDITSNGLTTGHLNNFGHLVNLTLFYIFANTSVTGTIEELIASWRANGRTTGNLYTYAMQNSNVTFNNLPLPTYTEINVLSWTADTITCNGVTINA